MCIWCSLFSWRTFGIYAFLTCSGSKLLEIFFILLFPRKSFSWSFSLLIFCSLKFFSSLVMLLASFKNYRSYIWEKKKRKRKKSTKEDDKILVLFWKGWYLQNRVLYRVTVAMQISIFWIKSTGNIFSVLPSPAGSLLGFCLFP